MYIRIQVIIEADHEATPTYVEEVACFERGLLSPETLGLQLDEAKQLLSGIQQVMAESQVEEYVEQQRQCSHCQQPLACKGHHQIGLRTLFGKLTLESPRFYTCACQPHQKRSWSPVAALFSERSTPELLCQEVRWASLLSYGVTVKLLGDLLPMEHQLSTSTISRHVHQVAERLEGELGDEQPSFIEGCPDQWYKLPEPPAPSWSVWMAATFTRAHRRVAKMGLSRSLWAKVPLETGRRPDSGWFPAMTPNLGDDSLLSCRLKDCR